MNDDRFDDASSDADLPRQHPGAEIFQHVARVLAPDSLLVDSHVELSRTSPRDRAAASEACRLTQPGDIILVTTPGFFYTALRALTQNPHDHAVVVVDAQRVMHIGPPRCRYLPLERLLLPKRQPAILRPMFDTLVARENFVRSLEALNGCAYDLQRANRVLLRLIWACLSRNYPLFPRLDPEVDWQPHAWICTDAIFVLLAAAGGPVWTRAIHSTPGLDYQKHGSSTLCDFVTLREAHAHLLQRIPLPAQTFRTTPASSRAWVTWREALATWARQLSSERAQTQTLPLMIYCIGLLLMMKRRNTIIKIVLQTWTLHWLGKHLLQHMSQSPQWSARL